MSTDKQQTGEALATLIQANWPAVAAVVMGVLTWAGKRSTDWIDLKNKEVARLRTERDKEYRQNVVERERQLADLREHIAAREREWQARWTEREREWQAQLAERDREIRALQRYLMQAAIASPGSGASKILAQLESGELKEAEPPEDPPPSPPRRRRH